MTKLIATSLPPATTTPTRSRTRPVALKPRKPRTMNRMRRSSPVPTEQSCTFIVKPQVLRMSLTNWLPLLRPEETAFEAGSVTEEREDASPSRPITPPQASLSAVVFQTPKQDRTEAPPRNPPTLQRRPTALSPVCLDAKDVPDAILLPCF